MWRLVAGSWARGPACRGSRGGARQLHASARRPLDAKIVVVAGDGVGPEVTREALKVLNAVAGAAGHTFHYDHQLIGGAAIDAVGNPLPDETLSACRQSHAVLLGAVGGPKWDNLNAHVRPEQGLLKIRKEMDLYANLRPILFFKSLLHASPLKPEIVDGVDILFVRELTGGIYFGPRQEEVNGSAHDVMVYTRPEVERIVRLAAQFAQARKGDLLSIDKANVLASSRLWRRTATQLVAKEFPGITLRHGLVDSCAMDIITKPRSFDVVVTENMFGDILTDEASVLSGSLGLLPSASLSDPGKPALYEPIHGSAPDIAGQEVVNPIACILSVAMLLRHSLGLNAEAKIVEDSVGAALDQGLRTQDLARRGEPVCSTRQMGDAVSHHVQQRFQQQRRGMATSVAHSGSTKPQTLFDKIWSSHVVDQQPDGTCMLYIDGHLVHEVTSPQAFEGLRLAGRNVRQPRRALATADHNVPTTERARGIADPESRLQVETLTANVAEFGLPYFGMDDKRQGIVHIVGPEQGFTQPGMTIVCGDSHTATHGALGALAFGIGTSEVEHVLATQTLLQRPAKNMRIAVDGQLLEGITSKDLVLHIIGIIGTAGGNGHVIEYAGEAVRALSMEARMSICNMSIEAGARAGMIAPDEITFAYLKGRPMAPKGELWQRAVDYWRSLPSDAGAVYHKEVTINAREIAPQVTWGTSPQDVLPITGSVPYPEDSADEGRRKAIARSLEYMGLQPGMRLQDVTVDKVFIGSCTNGRIEDLRQVAAIARGHKVAPGVHALVVPGSGLVKAQAEEEGIAQELLEAGFDWREPGCSMCLAMNADKLAPGERCASTSNRNFEGRQGRGGRTHLMSPAMAAAAALQGRLTDVREFAQRRSLHTSVRTGMEKFTVVSGVAAPLPMENVDTDMIIPASYLKTIKRSGLGTALFANMRYNSDGSTKSDFVLNRPPYREARILVAGDNFGCGSSREHAPWALLDFGIKVVIAKSFADIFFNNCFKNGILPVVLGPAELAAAQGEAEAGRSITVDLAAQKILLASGQSMCFEVDEFRKHCLINGLDDISLTLQKEAKITAFEAEMARTRPWI